MTQNSISSFSDSKVHYPILDALRGVAAIIVVWYHIFEGYATSRFDQIFNHGYLAVDFFFLLSGFVIAYAYDSRWDKLRLKDFFIRRVIRLHPMVVFGALLGGAIFYTQGCEWWDVSQVAVISVIISTLMSMFLIPTTTSFDVRGLGEAFPLNGPSWSLFFEYIGSFLYALFIRKFSTKLLIIWTIALAILLGSFAIFGKNGDVAYGWQFSLTHFPLGLTRMLLPFSIGLLMFRVTRASKIKGAFLFSSILLIAILSIPRIGDEQSLWANGLYDMLAIITIFPFIIYMGISGTITSKATMKICKFLGDISYPLYIVHYPFIYLYIAWVKNNDLPFSESWIGALALLLGSMLIAHVFTRIYDLPTRKFFISLIRKKCKTVTQGQSCKQPLNRAH
ncbi:MAG: acyltransferase family protein [Bacteroidales bacterium]